MFHPKRIMNSIFSVIPNLFRDPIHHKTRRRNPLREASEFGMTTIKCRGFTLIELLVAISIIGVLASFLLVNFIGVRQRARDGVRKSDLRQIQSALELYRADQGEYHPEPLPGCGSPLENGSTVYMKKIPCDPSTGDVYTYSVGVGNTTYTMTACLENTADPDGNGVVCGSGVEYRLENP